MVGPEHDDVRWEVDARVGLRRRGLKGTRDDRRITAETPLLRLIIGSRGRRNPCNLQLTITMHSQSDGCISQRSARPLVH